MLTNIYAQIHTAQAGQQTTHTHWNSRYYFNAPSDLHKEDALPPRDEVLFSDPRYTLLLVSSLANASQRWWDSHFSNAWHVVDDPRCGKGDTGSCTCHWATCHAEISAIVGRIGKSRPSWSSWYGDRVCTAEALKQGTQMFLSQMDDKHTHKDV